MWLTSTCCPRARWSAASIARLTSAPTRCRLYSAEPRRFDELRRDLLTPKLCFSFSCANRQQTDASQSDCNVLAAITLHRQLHGSTCGRIDRGRPLEGDVSTSAVPRRNLDDNL